MKSVIIISAWGRGAYLAYQLRQKDFDVTIYDVSSLFPPLSSEEREGPFGVFLPENLSDLQKKYLCGDNFEFVRQGFSILTSQGLMEFRGSLKSFFIKTNKDFALCYSTLSHLPHFSGKEKRVFLRQKIKKNTFSPLLLMAKRLTNSFVYDDKKKRENILFADSPKDQKTFPFLDFSPLFSEYVLRESSQRHFVELKSILLEKGVKWINIPPSQEGNTPIRFKVNKKNIQLKWNEQKNNSHFLVWTLSGPETKKYFYHEMPWLFPGWEEPVKIWRKFSLSWNQKGFENIIPSLLLVLPDYQSLMKKKTDFSLSFSQVRGGIISIKKNPEASHVDLWTLCSYGEHLSKQALKGYLRLLMEQLQIFFPGFSIKGILPDIDTCQNYFVLYKVKNKNRFFQKKTPSFVLHLNPEAAGKWDAYSIMQQSDFVFNKIVDLSE